MQPSASRTALLLQCTRAFGDVLVSRDPAGEPARYGLVWHEVAAWAVPFYLETGKRPTLKQMAVPLRKAVLTFDITHGLTELEAHLAVSLPKLYDWLDSLPKGKKQVFVETSLVLNTRTGKVKRIPNPTVDDHHYQTEGPWELPGTVDLAILIGNHLWVIDYKTGLGDFSRPDHLPQIRTLSLMFKTFLPKTRFIEAGIFHAFRRGIAKMYTDDLDDEDIRAHSKLLASQASRIGDGTMRPGPECDRCPARIGCPAGDSELLLKANALLKRLGGNLTSDAKGQPGPTGASKAKLALTKGPGNLSPEEKLGALYETILNGEQLTTRVREAIKEEMRQGALPVLSDGRVLVLKNREVERLSKREFISAYGELAAKRMFAKWRKDKALVKKPETYIDKAND